MDDATHQACQPSSELWTRLHEKVPVPADILEQARHEHDATAVIEALDSFKESGGQRFEDFYSELERMFINEHGVA
jgi:hypothetical protein